MTQFYLDRGAAVERTAFMPLTPSALVAPAAPSATNDSGVADGERWDVEAPPPPSGPRSAHRAHKLRQHGILRRLSRSSPRSSGPAPPAYKWHGEFSDRKLEEEYMRDEVLPILPGRVALSFLVMLMLGVMMIIVELVSSGADEVNLHRVLLETAVCVLWILASAYVRIAPRRGWPLAYVEYAVTWLFATSSVGGLCVIHFAPVFMSSMGARSVLHEDPLMVYVIAMVVLSVLAIAMPIRPVLFGAMAFTPAMTVATIESLHHFFSIGNLENREATALKHVVGTAFFCLFALSAAWVHAHVERVHRGAYHFFRDVELAAVENAALQSAEAEAKMRMRTVEAVKMARSRMIRMVRRRRHALAEPRPCASGRRTCVPTPCLTRPATPRDVRARARTRARTRPRSSGDARPAQPPAERGQHRRDAERAPTSHALRRARRTRAATLARQVVRRRAERGAARAGRALSLRCAPIVAGGPRAASSARQRARVRVPEAA